LYIGGSERQQGFMLSMMGRAHKKEGRVEM